MDRKGNRFLIGAGIILIMLLTSVVLHGQSYFRISAEFTVKIKRSDGSMNLTRGNVYYDKNIRELIYRITFPQEEQWVIRDTTLLKYRGDTLTEQVGIPSINDFTVFHLSLNAGLKDFGLKKSMFKVSKVERKNGMVLSYWKIPKKVSELISHVVVAKKENRLESVIIMGEQSRVISRQFYRDYYKIDAFEFPGQIVQILYDDEGKENYQVTEFSNIKVNDLEHEAHYRFGTSLIQLP
jgi:hypothetical protein